MLASSLIIDIKCNHCAWICMKQKCGALIMHLIEKTNTFEDIVLNAVTANGIWHPQQLKRITPFVNTYFEFQGCSLKFYPVVATKYEDRLYVLAMLFHKERLFKNAFGFRSLHMLYTHSVTLYDNPIILVLHNNVLSYSYDRKIALYEFLNMNLTRKMKT